MPDRGTKSATGFAVSVAVLLVLVIVVSMLLERAELSVPLRYALAILPVAAYAYCLVGYVGMVRQADELQQRVHLEALAIAFPSTAVAVLASEYLRKAGAISQIKPDYILILMLVLWAVGFLIAWRRYQ